jgi:hypothetical protein
MSIVPETKSWTWVLERACTACGFVAPDLERERVAPALRDVARDLATRLLAGDDAWQRTRPDPATWAPVEYACHVRDVFRIFDARLQRMLADDDPALENWDQDATAVADDYAAQDPDVVAAELMREVEPLAARFERVHGPQWDRPATRSDGARFTVDTFARYLVHDPVHHLWDLSR